jgi:bacteriocin biosynthesis cyclodehydratase domain-containing protein
MDNDIPGVREARYRLLGLQAVPHDDGVVIRRGLKQVFVRGAKVGELLDLIVERSAEGNGLRPDDLKAEIDPLKHLTFTDLIATLRAERFLVAIEERAGPPPPEGKEGVFYWSHGTSLEAVAANVAEVELAVFGVNHISLPLLGNLRSVGFRAVAFVDHPALRNLDFYDDRQDMRSEIAAALASNRPQTFDAWSASGDKPDCSIVCSDFGGLALMRDWNRTAVAANALFYPIVLQDEVAYLGPLVVPGEGPCFECMWARRNSNLDAGRRDHATEMHAFFGQKVASYLQPMARVAADLAAIDLLKYFSRTLPGGRAGRLIEADLMTPALITRNVLKVPRCPVCSRLPMPTEPAAAPPEGAA